jgi:hypothetical protein
VIGRFVAKKHSVNDAYYKGLLLGTDNRLSTSKLNASLWTVVLVYFLLALAFVAGFDASTFNNLVHKVNPLYLVLIGGPFAAAILSKGIVSSAVNAGMKKDTATAPKVADFFSNDDGNTDLADTQYVLFNVIAAFIVVVEFLRAPLNGPPDIPAFLAVLTGASAAAYVTNKGVTTSASTAFGQAAAGGRRDRRQDPRVEHDPAGKYRRAHGPHRRRPGRDQGHPDAERDRLPRARRPHGRAVHGNDPPGHRRRSERRRQVRVHRVTAVPRA